MSTTFVPDPMPFNPEVTPDALLNEVNYWLKVSFGDYDKAGDMEDMTYYGGLIDAYHHVQEMMTNPLYSPKSVKEVVNAATGVHATPKPQIVLNVTPKQVLIVLGVGIAVGYVGPKLYKKWTSRK